MIEVKLGDSVRSIVSGFSGVVTAKCEYLHGGTTYCVTAPVTTTGEVRDLWFYAAELVVEVES